MTREEARKRAEVMLAYADGAEIEISFFGTEWIVPALGSPTFNWQSTKYRVKQTKPSVDWSHVADECVALATHGDGCSFFTTRIPKLGQMYWEGGVDYVRARDFASFRPGTCDWKDSLVVRPGYKESEAV